MKDKTNMTTTFLDSSKNNAGQLKSPSDLEADLERPNPIKPGDWMLIIFIAIAVTYFLVALIKSSSLLPNVDISYLLVFNTVFISILIQAFPFLLLGVLVASVIQVFISSETIARIFPRSSGLGFIAAMLAGVFFPLCDCAVVPVAAGLVKRGVPLPVAVTFLLAAPIVNPIVIASTWYAFPNQPYLALLRVYFGLIIAFAGGFMFRLFPEENVLLLTAENPNSCSCSCSCGHNHVEMMGFKERVQAIFQHAAQEFFQVGKFLIFGALLSSAAQVFVPREVLTGVGGVVVPILIMMTAAFVLSVCSTSDAFIARTFANQFPMGAIMGFMILGPMIDIKNLLMLSGSFQKRVVIKLVLIIFCFTLTLMLVVAPLLN